MERGLLRSGPPVWRWYVGYCVAWALLYGGLVAFGAFLAIGSGPSGLAIETGDTAEVVAVVLFFGLSLLLAIAYAVAPLLPRRPWAWIYGIVLIGFSALGGCFPIAIPLLYFWVKPETRAHFGSAPRAELVAPAPATEAFPPASPEAAPARGRPPIWRWYVALCAGAALLYLGIGLVGVASFFVPELAGDPVEDAALAVLGLLLFPVCAVGAFVPRRPWAWTYGLTAIIVAMLTCCTLPAAIPVLIAWLKPETKAAFGRR